MLHALCKAIGDKATPITENGKIIGLKDGDGGSVSLEPGGQLIIRAPLVNLHETCAETGRHLRHMRMVSSALGVGMLGIGFQPKWDRDDISLMPKGRYQIMRNHMPKVGTMGLDMMLRSCTVQVNLDYADEEDMRKNSVHHWPCNRWQRRYLRIRLSRMASHRVCYQPVHMSGQIQIMRVVVCQIVFLIRRLL